MATPVLNNGIFMRDTSYQASSHLDSYHLRNMLQDAEPMDMGPVDLWAMAQKVEMPLYQLASFGGKNTIMVDNARGEYKWQTPVNQDLPYIIEDIESTNTSKGIDGTTFKIKINKREFGHGDIITYDKYNGAELYITADDIQPLGDGFIYTVQLVNNDNTKFLDNKYLANGTKLFRKGSARGEYGERFSDIITNTGFREFYNYVGGAEAHVHYSISSEINEPYFKSLNNFLSISFEKNIDIYPPKEYWFKALEYSSFEKTKVVILGQDPYHGEGQADGLSFSVPKEVAIPPSLRNIFIELEEDEVDFTYPQHGNLISWAKQGVLLLNLVLTVEKNKPRSHSGSRVGEINNKDY